MRLALFWILTAIIVIWTFRKPKVGLFYFLGLLLLRDGYLMENLPDIYTSWHMPIITGWLILIAWIANVMSNRTSVRKPVEILLMMLLAVIMWVSGQGAQYPGNSSYMLSEYVRVVILAFLIVNVIQNEKDLRDAATVLISIITFLVLFAYYRYKTEGFDCAVPSVYYVDRNFFAESIVSIFPLAFIFYEESIAKTKKILFLGVVAAMAVGVVLTYSRGGLLALAIVLAGLFMISKKKIAMAIMVIAVTLLFLPHIGAKYTGRMSTVAAYEEDASSMIRIATWKAGINMVKQNPWLGVGPGNFNDLFVSYAPEEMKSYADYTMSIHNIFLQVFSETGLIGGCVFVLMITSSIAGLFRLNKSNNNLKSDKRISLALPNALGVSLLGFCGAGFFLPGAYYGYLYIIIPLIAASRIMCQARIKENGA